MRRTLQKLAVLGIVVTVATGPQARAGVFQDLVDRFHKALETGSTLSSGDIVAGLKEALVIGTQNAVAVVSRADG